MTKISESKAKTKIPDNSKKYLDQVSVACLLYILTYIIHICIFCLIKKKLCSCHQVGLSDVKNQNISPISSVIFAGCIVTWGENIYESQILQGKSPNLFVNKKSRLMVTMHPSKITADIGEIF